MVQRRLARDRRESLVELRTGQEWELIYGKGILERRPMTREEFFTAWEIHGSRLTREYAERDPGSRPTAFWICEAPKYGERLVVDQEQYDQITAVPARDSTLVIHGVLAYGLEPAVLEPEFDFLLRHGLLLPGELEEVRRLEAEAEDEEQTETDDG